MTDTFAISADYSAWLREIKSRIQSAQNSVARSVNRELILLYWDIGRIGLGPIDYKSLVT